MISIRIENSIEKPILIKNGTIITDKRGRSGIGLLNMRKCVDAYDGSVCYWLYVETKMCTWGKLKLYFKRNIIKIN